MIFLSFEHPLLERAIDNEARLHVEGRPLVPPHKVIVELTPQEMREVTQ